jgi:hypothetical protein
MDYLEVSRPGWDSYNALPITTATRHRADALVRMLGQNISPPEASPCGDGSIQLDWCVGDCIEVELTIPPDSKPARILVSWRTSSGWVDTENVPGSDAGAVGCLARLLLS